MECVNTPTKELRPAFSRSNQNICLYLSINVLKSMSDSSQNKLKFTQKTDRLISDAASFKITFSKPKHQNKEVINCYLRTVMIKNQLQYSITNRYKTRDEVKNYTAGQLPDVIDHLLGNMFYNAVLFTETEEVTLMQSKKGKTTYFQKNLVENTPINTAHDHQKSRPIPENQTWLQVLGLADKEGKIFDKSQDKFRQINKYIEITDHLIKDFPQDQIITIVDMGSGKGYLTFALYDHLVNNKKMRCKITGYDVKEDMVTLCYNAAIKEGFVGLTFQQKNIDQVNVAGADMVIALHACDVATDIAIAKGIQAGARYIMASPCCHKQVRNSMTPVNVLSPILSHGILAERQAEILTDGIRALLMEAHGYRTQVFEFVSTEHTSKNLMITGVKGDPDPKAKEKVTQLKEFFGLKYHYLEKILDTGVFDIADVPLV